MKKLLLILLIALSWQLSAQDYNLHIAYSRKCDQLTFTAGEQSSDTNYIVGVDVDSLALPGGVDYYISQRDYPSPGDSTISIMDEDLDTTMNVVCTTDTAYVSIYQLCDTCNQASYDCNTYIVQSSDTFTWFSPAGRMYGFGTTSTFNYMHRTGIFRIKFDYLYTYHDVNQILLSTRTTTAATNGIYLYSNGNNLYIQFGSGSATILNTNWADCFVPYIQSADCNLENRYEIILVGDGTGIQLYVKRADGSSVDFGKKNFTGAIVNSGNQATALAIGGSSTAASLNSNALVNMKFYSTSDETTQVANFPMNSASTYNKETINNLTGTVVNAYVANTGLYSYHNDCVDQGWIVIADSVLDNNYTLSLEQSPYVTYLYVSLRNKYGIPINSYGYLTIVPKKFPIKSNGGIIQKNNKIYHANRHEILYENGCASPVTITMELQEWCGTATWGYMGSPDSMVWSTDDTWGSKPYHADVFPINMPLTDNDVTYYMVNSTTFTITIGGLRWFTPLTGIRVSHRIDTWF